MGQKVRELIRSLDADPSLRDEILNAGTVNGKVVGLAVKGREGLRRLSGQRLSLNALYVDMRMTFLTGCTPCDGGSMLPPKIDLADAATSRRPPVAAI